MSPRRRTALLVLAVLMFVPVANAQNAADRPSPIDYEAIRRQVHDQPGSDVASISGDDLRRIAAAQTNYQIWSLDHRRASFQWQYRSSVVIFVAVMALVACGLYFSYTQFKGSSGSTQTSIKLGRDGLEISSPVIGLLILIIAFGFFYLYLTNVYPISEVGMSIGKTAPLA